METYDSPPKDVPFVSKSFDAADLRASASNPPKLFEGNSLYCIHLFVLIIFSVVRPPLNQKKLERMEKVFETRVTVVEPTVTPERLKSDKDLFDIYYPKPISSKMVSITNVVESSTKVSIGDGKHSGLAENFPVVKREEALHDRHKVDVPQSADVLSKFMSTVTTVKVNLVFLS